MWASRRRAWSRSSRTNMAAPSPRTNPSRLMSNGREACSASSLRGVVALIASKQASVIGEIGASVDPAIMMSADRSRISSTAYPTESSPDVQPVDTTVAGPSAPTAWATSTANELGTRYWYRCRTARSWTTRYRWPSSLTVRYSRSRPMVAPTAVPTVTPTRAGSRSDSSIPLSATASRVATTANCAARSIRATSAGVSPAATGSKSTSAATCDRNGDGSKKLIRRVAVRPSVSRVQNSLAPTPPGAMTPIPVIATRRRTSGSSNTDGGSGRLLPVVEPGGQGIGRGPPGGRVVRLDERLEVGAHLDEQRIRPGLLDRVAAGRRVEVLEMEVQAAVVEQLPPAGTHPVRHVCGVEPLEDSGDVGLGIRTDPGHDQRAVHGFPQLRCVVDTGTGAPNHRLSASVSGTAEPGPSQATYPSGRTSRLSRLPIGGSLPPSSGRAVTTSTRCAQPAADSRSPGSSARSSRTPRPPRRISTVLVLPASVTSVCGGTRRPSSGWAT